MQHKTPFELFDPHEEHDACGVGFVARLDGRPEHQVVADALRALARLAHRGSRGSDGASGDGAGILLPLPRMFFKRVFTAGDAALAELLEKGVWGLGQFFWGPGDHHAETETLIESCLRAEGLKPVAWRDVPVRPECLGPNAKAGMPRIRQLLVVPEMAGELDGTSFERKLYVARRRIEKASNARFQENPDALYTVSLSGKSIVYKGMIAGGSLADFYEDLRAPDFKAAFAIFHERYSTNTCPAWRLAQPFHYLAHNGEINTLRGNLTRMKVREPVLSSPLFGDRLDALFPVLDERESDSANLDRALEFVVQGGRSLPHAMMMLVPEPFGDKFIMGDDKRAFYRYHAAVMEPWDGPSALVFTDGATTIGAMLDRNGLRPCRYTVTRDGLVILASEAGILDIPPERTLKQGRLQPRKMFMVDLTRHRIVSDAEIKNKVIHAQPYRRWVHDGQITLAGLHSQVEPVSPTLPLRVCQVAHGYTQEDIRTLLAPMARNAQEPIGSMGNDAAPAMLSERPQLMFHYFKQQFAQVTNPPIDPLREELVMSLMSTMGRQGNLLEETPDHVRQLRLPHPVLTPEELAGLRGSRHPEVRVAELDATFPLPGTGKELKARLDTLFAEAETALSGSNGSTLLLLSDRRMSPNRLPIPCLLAASGLHHHLIRRGLRHCCGILVESGEVREVIHIAQLVAFGVNAVCPYTAFETIRNLSASGKLEKTPDEADRGYIAALRKGLLKTLARLGIATLRGFWGTQAFEALGLCQEVMERYFTGAKSRLDGIGLEELATETRLRHARAFELSTTLEQSPAEHQKGSLLPPLEQGGAYRYRSDGERRQWTPEVVQALHKAVRENNRESYKAFADELDTGTMARTSLRGQLRFRKTQPVPLEEVEPVEAITRRFIGAAMSLGAISPEAHEAIAIAMNRLGGRSNSGEGGEDSTRNMPDASGNDRRSRIRQIAAGRFGVTLEYLVHADELQIKIAQGAKPGEGGQLPAHKVTAEIARLRHSTPGVTLISPPPHHDIYSIEDLAQLIFDLKKVNPRARISVKLVAEAGIGTVATGVAKAGADIIVVSGSEGGTGASPLTAIRHVGLPWEMGLAEVQVALSEGGLRRQVLLQTDGLLKTGLDVVMAALLGAEEYAFGTGLLVSLGCSMLRKCHLDTCPFGVATQNPALRARFQGQPEHVERYLRFLAEDVRRHLATLGYHCLDEIIGHVELLEPKRALSVPDSTVADLRRYKADHLDVSRLLHVPSAAFENRRHHEENRPAKLPDTPLEEGLSACARRCLTDGTACYTGPIKNIDRTVGARISGDLALAKAHLAPDTLRITLEGSAGQSLGAFLAPGVLLRVDGEANDYVGKGLSGGTLVVRPPESVPFTPGDQVVIGNVALYGAIAGEAYFLGRAGERFAVRNSGAETVVEGVGDHGCEYMTGGRVVILGPTGYNFAAGMSGGVAYVYDTEDRFPPLCNMDSVDLESVSAPEDVAELRRLITRHAQLTGSHRAWTLLDTWESSLPLFIKIIPIEYQKALERSRQAERRSVETVSATEEVF